MQFRITHSSPFFLLPSRISTHTPPQRVPIRKVTKCREAPSPPKKIRGRGYTQSLNPGSQSLPSTPLPPHRHRQTGRSHQPVHHRRPRLRYRTRRPEHHVVQRWEEGRSHRLLRRHTQRRNRVARDESNKRRRRCIDDPVTRQIIRCHHHISRHEQSIKTIAEEKPADGVHGIPGKIKRHC